MNKNKSYALIHLDNKVLKKNYDTASAAKNDFPESNLIELFNCNNIRLVSIGKI